MGFEKWNSGLWVSGIGMICGNSAIRQGCVISISAIDSMCQIFRKILGSGDHQLKLGNPHGSAEPNPEAFSS
jgi:hypothetical protein